ncbi:arsenate reductase family protein [Gaopeijia maritima]|uniref:Arsenate reductase family protein n=1 Tax=Gaopeijia maritima TaxID=3119007 RepID=A0ABU9EDJ4_9BACT
MQVQIFGTKGCSDTRKAERFFKERRIRIHFMDLRQRAASKGELRRFVQKFGIDAVIDRESKRFRALGLHQAHYGDDRWLDILADEPGILRTPMVRHGNDLSIGYTPDAWAAWVD